MKIEWMGIMPGVSVMNTPLECGYSDAGGATLIFSGVNSTPEGDWVPAPGFPRVESPGERERLLIARAEAAEAKLAGLQQEREDLLEKVSKLERECATRRGLPVRFG